MQVCYTYCMNDLRDIREKKVFIFSIFDILGHRQAINMCYYTHLKVNSKVNSKVRRASMLQLKKYKQKKDPLKPNIRKSLSTTLFYVDLGPKRYLGLRDLIIVSMRWGGGV